MEVMDRQWRAKTANWLTAATGIIGIATALAGFAVGTVELINRGNSDATLESR
jgi:hypothetical protein